MTLNKMLAASVVGALTLSSSVFAKRTLAQDHEEHAPEVNTSYAKCSAVSIGYSKVTNDKAIADVSAQANSYICGDGTKSAADIAEETAAAFAIAVASASVECELFGDASFEVEAKASAEARAKVWVAAYASALGTASTCEKCDAYAASHGYIEKWVFLKAVAEASISLSGYSTADDIDVLLFKVVDYDKEIKGVVAKAFATALTAAAKFKDTQGCAAWVNAGGCIYTVDHPDEQQYCGDDDNLESFECSAVAVSGGDSNVINAVADASAKAVAFSCGDSVAIADLEVYAEALAEATAESFSFAFASCTVSDGGFACSAADTDIKQVAYAVAEAYAKAYSVSLSCDGCKSRVDLVVEAVGDVLVKAMTSAWESECGSGTTWTKASFKEALKSSSLCAMAEAHALAISIKGGVCLGGGIVYADVSEGYCPNPEH